MTKMIFINLPVRNLPKARAFYEALGAWTRAVCRRGDDRRQPNITGGFTATILMLRQVNTVSSR
jgi:predicted lactoylglutathione lyase